MLKYLNVNFFSSNEVSIKMSFEIGVNIFFFFLFFLFLIPQQVSRWVEMQTGGKVFSKLSQQENL